MMSKCLNPDKSVSYLYQYLLIGLHNIDSRGQYQVRSQERFWGVWDPIKVNFLVDLLSPPFLTLLQNPILAYFEAKSTSEHFGRFGVRRTPCTPCHWSG